MFLIANRVNITLKERLNYKYLLVIALLAVSLGTTVTTDDVKSA